MVHSSPEPACARAYAVTVSAAHKLLAEALEGYGDVYDLMLTRIWKSEKIKCMMVCISVLNHAARQKATGAKSRLVINDAGPHVNSSLTRSFGHTDKVLEITARASFSDPTSK